MWLLATGLAVKSPVAVKITSGPSVLGQTGHFGTLGVGIVHSLVIHSESIPIPDFGSEELIPILIPG